MLFSLLFSCSSDKEIVWTNKNYVQKNANQDYNPKDSSYYIWIENQQPIKQNLWEKIWYFYWNIYKKNGNIFLWDKKLIWIDGHSFKHVDNNFMSDKNGVYYIEIECSYIHWRCSWVKSIKKIHKIDTIKSPETFHFLKSWDIAKDDYYLYSIGYKWEVKRIKWVWNTFEPIKFIESVQISWGDIWKNIIKSFKNIKNSELDDILKHYPRNKYDVKIQYKNTRYNKDEYNIYYWTKKVIWADYATFEVIKYQIWQDKKFKYLRWMNLQTIYNLCKNYKYISEYQEWFYTQISKPFNKTNQDLFYQFSSAWDKVFECKYWEKLVTLFLKSCYKKYSDYKWTNLCESYEIKNYKK